MNFRCPVCRVPLKHVRTAKASQWTCGTCLGRAVAMGVLRRVTNRRVVTGFWNAARSAEVTTQRPCPCCEKPMACVSRSLPDGDAGPAALELDACTRCQMFWFDPGEFEGMPTSIPEQVESPGESTKDLPAEARIALMHARLKTIQERADAEAPVPDGLVDLMAGILLLPVELDDDAPARLNVPWVTAMLVLAVITCTASLGFVTEEQSAANQLVFISSDPWRFGGLTLLSSFFVHAGWLHLLGNLYFLWSFGDNVEDVLGPLRFALLWFVATVLSVGAYGVVASSDHTWLAGASGGVSALVVAYALFYPRAKLGILFFLRWMVRFPAWMLAVGWFALQILGFSGELFGAGGGGIAYMAHLVGAAVGGAGWLLWKDRMR